MSGLYSDNGNEHGNYYLGLRLWGSYPNNGESNGKDQVEQK